MSFCVRSSHSNDQRLWEAHYLCISSNGWAIVGFIYIYWLSVEAWLLLSLCMICTYSYVHQTQSEGDKAIVVLKVTRAPLRRRQHATRKDSFASARWNYTIHIRITPPRRTFKVCTSKQIACSFFCSYWVALAIIYGSHTRLRE